MIFASIQDTAEQQSEGVLLNPQDKPAYDILLARRSSFWDTIAQRSHQTRNFSLNFPERIRETKLENSLAPVEKKKNFSIDGKVNGDSDEESGASKSDSNLLREQLESMSFSDLTSEKTEGKEHLDDILSELEKMERDLGLLPLSKSLRDIDQSIEKETSISKESVDSSQREIPIDQQNLNEVLGESSFEDELEQYLASHQADTSSNAALNKTQDDILKDLDGVLTE